MKKYCLGLLLAASSITMYGIPSSGLTKSEIMGIFERVAATENPTQADQMDLMQATQGLMQLDEKDLTEAETKRLTELGKTITCRAIRPMCTACNASSSDAVDPLD